MMFNEVTDITYTTELQLLLNGLYYNIDEEKDELYFEAIGILNQSFFNDEVNEIVNQPSDETYEEKTKFSTLYVLLGITISWVGFIFGNMLLKKFKNTQIKDN